MSKPTIVKTWLAGLVALAGGLILAMGGVFVMLAFGGSFTRVSDTNWDFNPALDAAFWMSVAIISLGGLIAVVGSIVQLVAWVGAVVNSYPLPDRTWFMVLLIGGVASFVFAPAGFAVMIAYIIAAPDGEPYRRQTLPAPVAPAAPAAT